MSNQTKNATLVGGGGQKPLNNQSLETKEILKSKIQDSKIQLESNSPKLKDSDSKLESKNPNKIQSPKASKNLVNPQSLKVLESNLKLDSKTRQKSKESSKVKSLIRTIPVSIALASALSSHAVADWQIGQGTNIDLKQLGTIQNGGIIVDNVNVKFSTSQAVNERSFLYGVAANQTGNDLTINNNSSIEFYALNGPMIKIDGNATVGIITNGGILIRERFGGLTNYKVAFDLGNSATTEAFINNGRIYWEGANVISLWSNSHIGIIKNTGTIQTEGAAIATPEPNVTIGSIELEGGVLQRINSSGSANSVTLATGDVISLANNANVGKIIVSNSASIHGNISLSRTTITDKISFGDSNMTGNISLGGSQVANGISIDNSKISGNISIAAGNNTNSTIANGVTLTNNSTIGDFTLDNGSSILNGLTLSNDSTITNLNVTKRGNIDELLLSQGTINGNLKVEGNADGAGTNTATIGEITLANNSTITGDISVKGDGASNNANAKIGNITLEDGTGIGGSIAVGDSNGAANTNGEIAGITLYGNSTIAGGIINNANGNIGTIISDTNNGVSNTITNSGTIAKLDIQNENTGGNGGTIVYRSDSGIITDTLSVASGATLAIKDSTGSNTGTIELKSNSLELEDGSTLNLANGSTLVGHLKNSGNLGNWTNESNIQGHFINEGTIGILNAGSIRDYLENTSTGFIQTLTEGKITGTLNNTGTIGELNTSVINYTNGNTNIATIAGAGHYGILNIDKNTIMDNNNTITNALKVDKNNSGNGYTLTINNGGSGNGTLYFNSTNGTIDNAGTILGSIDNGSGSTISIFTNIGTIDGNINNNGTITDFTNSGSISGTFTNKGHIVKFVNESTGSINNFTNNNTISFFENNGIITSFNGNNGT
ncbi:hypothetical protein F7P74_08365, partial [Helicobacter pullorum NCTC 12824]